MLEVIGMTMVIMLLAGLPTGFICWLACRNFSLLADIREHKLRLGHISPQNMADIECLRKLQSDGHPISDGYIEEHLEKVTEEKGCSDGSKT